MSKNETFTQSDLKPNFNPTYTKIEDASDENNWGSTWKNIKTNKK